MGVATLALQKPDCDWDAYVPPSSSTPTAQEPAGVTSTPSSESSPFLCDCDWECVVVYDCEYDWECTDDSEAKEAASEKVRKEAILRIMTASWLSLVLGIIGIP
jgi:hypothetical protein